MLTHRLTFPGICLPVLTDFLELFVCIDFFVLIVMVEMIQDGKHRCLEDVLVTLVETAGTFYMLEGSFSVKPGKFGEALAENFENVYTTVSTILN